MLDCDIAVCINFHDYQRIARPVPCMAHITYEFCVNIDGLDSADNLSLSSTAGIADERNAAAFEDAKFTPQSSKGQGIELTSISSCASTGRWGLLCQKSAIDTLLHHLCCPNNNISEGDFLQGC